MIVFNLIARLTTNNGNNKINKTTFAKGLAGRAFFTFALANDLPQSLTFFAALKIATTIKEEDKISNDFYLLGNLLSITWGIMYSKIYFNYFGL
ncbi:hypothetical protein [Fulvivirga sp. M361]|uniref:hypothetical protein n=1 Tax=Fulvivirga sp. M361 TaxID=2594266 RepID=UPI001624F38C|nr:hypothetical protein [Fulvivirga sp. M361]